MSNCRNCGAAANIYNDGCDYCGTNVPIKRQVSYFEGRPLPRSAAIPPSHNFNPRDWGHYDPACNWWRTKCGHDVEIVRHYIESYGEDAPIKWKESTGKDWPKRVKQ